jgi:hypothetical protein
MIEQSSKARIGTEAAPMLHWNDRPTIGAGTVDCGDDFDCQREPPWKNAGHPGAAYSYTSLRLAMVIMNTVTA